MKPHHDLHDSLRELRFIPPLLQDAVRGVVFDTKVASRVGLLMRHPLAASDAHRLTVVMEIIDVVGHAEKRE